MNSEPVAIIAIIKAVIILATAFGLHLSVEQIAAVYGVVEAVGTVVQRARVTPVA